MIVQPKDKFGDFKAGKDVETKVFRVYSDFSYFIPAEYDVLISFDNKESYGTCDRSRGSIMNLIASYTLKSDVSFGKNFRII